MALSGWAPALYLVQTVWAGGGGRRGGEEGAHAKSVVPDRNVFT